MEPRPFDLAAHRARIADCLRRVPDVHDREALERLGQRCLEIPEDAGGGAMRTLPEVPVGERRRTETLGLVVECVGRTALGWVRYVYADNRAQGGSCPPALWAEYAPVEGVPRG